MNADSNKAVVRRLWECLNRHDYEPVNELVDPDFVNHVDGKPGVEAWKAIFSSVTRSFPNMRWEVVTLVGEDDVVVAHVVGRGTHTGEPWHGIPASDADFSWDTAHFYRLCAGRIIEHSAVRDDLSFYDQLRRPAFGPEQG